MKGVAWVGVFLIALAGARPTSGRRPHTKFTPPAVVYAGDIKYPANSSVAGLVTLCVGLDGSGHVQDLRTLRDIPSLTAPASLAVNDWTFAPALLNGKPRPSPISVNVLFSPPLVLPKDVPLSPLEEKCGDQDMGFFPAEVAGALYGPFVMNSTTIGTIVLDVTVGKTGRVEKVSAVWPEPTRAKRAIATVSKWKFKPGTLDGVPVDSQTIVAFVFGWN